MTKIPDDVVERARDIINRDFPYSPEDETIRAAGEVFVAWEREQCAALAKRYAEEFGSNDADEIADLIRARSAPEKE